MKITLSGNFTNGSRKILVNGKEVGLSLLFPSREKNIPPSILFNNPIPLQDKNKYPFTPFSWDSVEGFINTLNDTEVNQRAFVRIKQALGMDTQDVEPYTFNNERENTYQRTLTELQQKFPGHTITLYGDYLNEFRDVYIDGKKSNFQVFFPLNETMLPMINSTN